MDYQIHQTIRELGLNKNTVSDFYLKMRQSTFGYCLFHTKPIGGDGHIVEIDETCMVKRKYNAGRYTESMHTWYFGGIDRDTKEFFIVQVQDRKKSTLMQYDYLF